MNAEQQMKEALDGKFFSFRRTDWECNSQFNADGSSMTYSWQADFAASYTWALRMLALRCGSVRFSTIEEMYFIEREGGIP